MASLVKSAQSWALCQLCQEVCQTLQAENGIKSDFPSTHIALILQFWEKKKKSQHFWGSWYCTVKHFLSLSIRSRLKDLIKSRLLRLKTLYRVVSRSHFGLQVREVQHITILLITSRSFMLKAYRAGKFIFSSINKLKESSWFLYNFGLGVVNSDIYFL